MRKRPFLLWPIVKCPCFSKLWRPLTSCFPLLVSFSAGCSKRNRVGESERDMPAIILHSHCCFRDVLDTDGRNASKYWLLLQEEGKKRIVLGRYKVQKWGHSSTLMKRVTSILFWSLLLYEKCPFSEAMPQLEAALDNSVCNCVLVPCHL